MVEYLVAGGPVMVPILLCSVIALGTFLERMWVLRRERVAPRSLCVELSELVKQDRWEDGRTLCRKKDVAVARIIDAGLELHGAERQRVKERLEEVGRREMAEMERFIPILGTIASISPLLGLLGTVGGMIVTFQVISDAGGTADVSTMASGISQALITTFAGLTVGIPALVANRYALARVDSLGLDLEEFSLEMLDLIAGKRGE